MNESAPEPTVASHAINRNDLFWALQWVCCLLIVVASVPNILGAFSIQKFNFFFHDAFPGRLLPYLTTSVIEASLFLRILSLGLPIVGIVNVIYGQKLRSLIVRSTIIIALIALQSLLTWTACSMPIPQSLGGGMSDQDQGGH